MRFTLCCFAIVLFSLRQADAEDHSGYAKNQVTYRIEVVAKADAAKIRAAVLKHYEKQYKTLFHDELAVWGQLPMAYREVKVIEPKAAADLIPIRGGGIASEAPRGLQHGFRIVPLAQRQWDRSSEVIAIQIHSEYCVPHAHWTTGDLMQTIIQHRAARAFAESLQHVAQSRDVAFELVSAGNAQKAMLPKRVRKRSK